MRDLQAQFDDRGVSIDSVGISRLRMPTTFDDGEIRSQGIATFDVTVELQAERRGTHMSRLVHCVREHFSDAGPDNFRTALKAVRQILDAPSASISMSLPLPIEVVAPISGLASHSVFDVAFQGQQTDTETRLTTTVLGITTSLCPCSKEISDYGAHNQRSEVTVQTMGFGDFLYPISVSEVYALIAASGSCPVIPLLKRPDERQVTMAAYDNPVFVEDMIRTITLELRSRLVKHSISVRNLESIHEHDAVASLSWL